MKLRVLQENLSKALLISSRFVSSKAQLPVLANVMLQTKKNKLIVTSTNLETSISQRIGANIEVKGSITVPAKTINDLVSNLNAGTIQLESHQERLKITSSNFRSNISGVNTADFPEVPTVIGKGFFLFDSKELLRALDLVLFAVSSDETRPVLTGVLLILKKGSVDMVATDGFRLSKKSVKIDYLKSSARVILPRRVLSEISRMEFEGNRFKFLNKTSESQVIFADGDWVMSSRVIEGEFPDFEKIIPKTFEINVSLDRGEMLQAVKLASVFARESANMVKLTINSDSISISSESSASGSQSIKIDAKVNGVGKNKFEIAFNCKFLEDYLNAVDGEDVNMEFTNSNAPGVFKDPKDKTFLHLIMPVKMT